MTTPEQEVDIEQEDIGELDIAEYLVFILALGTYIRYVGEQGGPGSEDDLIRKAIMLVKLADRRHMAVIHAFMGEHLPNASHKKMLDKAFRFLPNTQGIGRRSLQIRAVLSRGGPSTMRAIFKTNKALQDVRLAMAASAVDDADEALDKFAVIPMRNQRLRKWIDSASEQAGSGTFQNAVTAGSNEAAADVPALFDAKAQQQSAEPASEASREAADEHDQLLLQVQTKATDAAARSMSVSGEPDVAPTKSEVIGIAAAAVASALSNPQTPANVPEPLKSLDPEQLAAALTDGKVLVAAGAGAGKSTTLVSRIDYLVKDRKANPSRILACSFNKKAADELKGKIAKKLGGADSVQVGTMHSLFYRFIVGDKQNPGFGTPEEQAMLKSPRLIAPPKKGAKTISPTSLSTAIRNLWVNCDSDAMAARYGFPLEWVREPPKAKKAGLLLNKWRGNDIGLDAAKKSVTSKAEAQAVIWYEMYLGLKGDLPGWRPPCMSESYDRFMKKNRPGGERLGDLDDMLQVFKRILARDPNAKAKIQGMFDHFLVDECQDLNLVQHQIFDMLTEHIGDGSDGKSLWMIGDDKQAIYQFRGARPELFTSLDGKPGWKTRMIKTNYRCEAEIVDAANRLVAHNDGNIPMEARANPSKKRGKASIIVETPADNTDAAISTIGGVAKDIATEDAKPENYAVLARTNAELNDFETACIINEIPYVRRGGKGFLEAPESKAVLGYMDLVTGSNYEKMKESLVAVLMKPDRSLFMGPDDVLKAVDEALDDVARRERVDVRSVNPTVLLERQNVRNLADRLKQTYKLKIVNSAKDRKTGEWMYGKRVDELADNLRGLAGNLRDLNDFIASGVNDTKSLLNFILDSMPSKVAGWERGRGAFTTTTTLREQITHDTSIFSDDDDDDDEEETEVAPEISEEGTLNAPKKEEAEDQGKGLGAVQFLYQLAVPNANDEQNNTDPSTAQGFVAKIARYAKLSETLRIDPDKWEREQSKIGSHAKPPAITLSTVHGVKGLEWNNVSVLMPKGKFPPERKPREDEPPPDPIEEAEKMKAERNLAYVALTRAAVNLEILCPERTGGKEGGVSQFVFEAGLKMGENVPKEPAPAPEVDVKTAAVLDPDIQELFERYSSEIDISDDDMPGYDRRQS
jgi:superfamily I DNA/RNA helicase